MSNLTRANIARAMVEGMLASQVVMVRAIESLGLPIARVYLIGGGAQSTAVRNIVPQIIDVPIVVPEPGEYVAQGAAAQAAAALTGTFPAWEHTSEELARQELEPVVMEQHEAAKAALGYPTQPAP